MYNWNNDEKKLKSKMSNDQYVVWRLEQLINYGLGVDKLDLATVYKYWEFLNIDPFKKLYLQRILESENYIVTKPTEVTKVTSK